jgi:hypothetical protein
MEQPRGEERPCVNNYECYCWKMNRMWADNVTHFSPTTSGGFICKEWLLPDERLAVDLKGASALPKQRRPCIVCIDEELTRVVYDHARQNMHPIKTLNQHCVYVGSEGELSKEECFPHFWSVSGRKIWTGISMAYPIFHEINFIQDAVEVKPNVFLRRLRLRPRYF